MDDFQSKYSGEQIEEILDNVKNVGAYSMIQHGSNDTTFVLTPNTFHMWDNVSALTLTLGDAIDGVMNEYLFQVVPNGDSFTLTLPSNIKWHDDTVPDFSDASFVYQVSIINNCAAMLRFKK